MSTAIVTMKDARKAMKEAEKSKKRLARMRNAQKSEMEQLTRTGSVMVGAFGMAWFKGRYPERATIVGLDASLVVGSSLVIGSMMGWAGDQDLIVESLGTGILAGFATSKGFEMGESAAQKAA